MKTPMAVGLLALSTLTGHGAIMLGGLLCASVSSAAYRQSRRRTNAEITARRPAALRKQEAAEEAVRQLSEAYAAATAHQAAVRAKALLALQDARESQPKLDAYKALYDEHIAARRASDSALKLLQLAEMKSEDMVKFVRNMPQVLDPSSPAYKVRVAGVEAATLLFPWLAIYAAAEFARGDDT